jgi:hypothetical protein
MAQPEAAGSSPTTGLHPKRRTGRPVLVFVHQSDVLSHLRPAVAALNQTVEQSKRISGVRHRLTYLGNPSYGGWQ